MRSYNGKRRLIRSLWQPFVIISCGDNDSVLPSTGLYAEPRYRLLIVQKRGCLSECVRLPPRLIKSNLIILFIKLAWDIGDRRDSANYSAKTSFKMLAKSSLSFNYILLFSALGLDSVRSFLIVMALSLGLLVWSYEHGLIAVNFRL